MKPITKLQRRRLRGCLKRLGGYANLARQSGINLQIVWRMINGVTYVGGKVLIKKPPVFRAKTLEKLKRYLAKESASRKGRHK